MRTLVAVEIEHEGDLCDVDCTVCCNFAGDRQWTARLAGVPEGHFDRRGPDCFTAASRYAFAVLK